jgi:Flp pilus assembly protein TadD
MLGLAGPLDEGARALAAGRLHQATELLAAARQQGEKGARLERLEADLTLSKGDAASAFDRYQMLIAASPADPTLIERAGLAALRSRRDAEASALLARATGLAGVGWQAWNLRGVAADRRADFADADAAYARAASLAPGEASIVNNRGWSLMLRGHWADAETQFLAALALDPRVANGAANLELARAALSGGLPARLPGEGDAAFAARLNDAGVVAAADGDRTRAIAAFTRAIDARSSWFGRAARNLDAVTKGGR